MKRVIVLAAACVASAAGLARATDITGNHENPNEEFGKDASYNLVGDATFGWRTGMVPGDIDLNGEQPLETAFFCYRNFHNDSLLD